jgi:hypothetical protein
MGRWNISITGTGCHHNKNRAIDADLAARDFVDVLKRQGHTIEAAKFDLVGSGTSPEDLLRHTFVNVVLNGRLAKIKDGLLPYGEIACMADLPVDCPTVTYSFGVNGKSGELKPDETLEVVEGTVICAADTSNA